MIPSTRLAQRLRGLPLGGLRSDGRRHCQRAGAQNPQRVAAFVQEGAQV